MAFIGNTNTTQAFTPAVDFFSGNASTTAFTLSKPVASAAQVQAVIENVPQNPGSAFTVSGNTITFTSAPPSGTNNIYVYYTSPITQVIQPSQGTVNKTQLDVGSGGAGTGSMFLPSGTTAQRPASSVAGQQRWNTDTGAVEFYSGTSWFSVGVYSADYLVVAGGASGGAGSGGSGPGGGGGAGGYVATASNLTSGLSYSVVVGAGGAATVGPGGTSNANPGSNGSNSSFNSSTAIGGGAGGAGSSANSNGGNGGSGGGAGGNSTFNGVGGSGTSGQGNAGASAATQYNSAGGGGAGAAGSGTAGGAGLNWQSLGTYYAGGGGGSINSLAGGAGGAGGGGAGGTGGAAGTAGTANTGGGGGGGGNAGTGANSGAGGSGVVIIRYAGAQRGSGGTVTSSGGYTYHTFTTSGTFTA